MPNQERGIRLKDQKLTVIAFSGFSTVSPGTLIVHFCSTVADENWLAPETKTFFHSWFSIKYDGNREPGCSDGCSHGEGLGKLSNRGGIC